MVLAELGGKISDAIHTMSNSVIIDDAAVDKMTNAISLALLQGDVDVSLVKKMKTNIKKELLKNVETGAGQSKRKMIEGVVIKELYGLLDSGVEPYKLKKGKTNVVMFVGLQGSGKTTTCTKYAYYYKKKGWKVCLVCADTFRAGAFDQLKQNAAKAKVPFYGSYTERDPVIIAEEGVRRFREAKYEIIIVDTSGRHKQEAALFEEMQEVARVVQPDTSVFVMDSSIGQAAKLQATAFRDAVDIGSVIITKLDGHAKGGGALSAVAATQSPIIFVGTGEHMDEFEAFDTQGFVSRLLGRGDIKGLMSMFEGKQYEQSQQDLMKKINEGGGFTFRDMYQQFTTLLSMGPLGKIMSMIPGIGTAGMDANTEKTTKKQFKSFMTMMDSMADNELDGDDTTFTDMPDKGRARMMRLAQGSGTHPQHVEQLINMFIPFRKLFATMKNMPMGGGKGGGMPDLSALMSGKGGKGGLADVMKHVDPRMMQRMGGMGGLQNMMSEMMGSLGGGGGGKGGKMPKLPPGMGFPGM